VKRKLAAVMFTDIVGYSALSHRDEALAFALLGEHQALVRPLIARFRGREIRTIGDAFFLEFGSAVDALEFAVELQGRLAARNATESAERRLRVRVGIHLGDVIATDGDLYGDGVNIAARLQTLAAPGGICLSGQVYDQVHNKTDRPIRFVGTRRLKNIRKPVKVFRLELAPAAPGPARIARLATWGRELGASRSRRIATFSTAALALIGLLSAVGVGVRLDLPTRADRVAVAPFTELGPPTAPGDVADGAYLSEGLTDELIAQLSSVPGIQVLGRTTTAALRDPARPLPALAHELGIARVITGSIRRDAGRLRITVQLADARTQVNLWSEEFDGRLEEIFATQKRIAARVAARMSPEGARTPATTLGALRAGGEPGGPAYLDYLKGRYFLNRRAKADLMRGLGYFERAVRAEPEFAAAHVGIANAWGLLGYYGFVSPREALDHGRAAADRALALDPKHPEALANRAMRRLYYDHDFRGAEEDFLQAVGAAPGYAAGQQWYGEFLLTEGRFDEAAARFGKALELDPLSLPAQTARGLADYYAGHLDHAIRKFSAVLEMDPTFVPAHLWLGRAYLAAGEPERAAATLERGWKLSGGTPLLHAVLAQAWAAGGQTARARQALGRLTVQASARYVSAYDLASLQEALGERDAALASLARAFDERAYYLVYLHVDPLMARLRGDARFAELGARLPARADR
jgi:class 3 adenylate cyclase/TolB-like protein/tetratricopeptide (TPR) repeat protein